VYIKRLGGQVLFSRSGGRWMHPASCTKLVTASAALRSLTPRFRFDTVLRGRTREDRLLTPLFLWGQGDPTLGHADLERMAARLHALGIRRIPRGIVVDDHYFSHRRFPPGFGRPSSSRFTTPTGALSLDQNTVTLRIAPTAAGRRARVTVIPSSAYVELRHQVRTASRTKLWLKATRNRTRRGPRLRVRLSGTVAAGASPVLRRARVMDPSYYVGHTLKQALQRRGISVGRVRRGRHRKAPELIRHRSAPLGDIVQKMNLHSSNFIAEQLTKLLGAKRYGTPGTTRKGLRAARGLLRRAGVPPGRYRMTNGSGLFGHTRFAPRQLVRLLERLHTLPWLYRAVRRSLPVAGASGTLAGRLNGTPASGRVRAKTGTLKQVSCLAGYVDAPGGRPPLVFAIVVNRVRTSTSAVRKIQDRMVTALARYLLQTPGRSGP
jgi:D-alanyl-D-alanine carboxypeptidase/D-alanyl-D-alanine-endopeptidase (penicillin-binding protein 4)